MSFEQIVYFQCHRRDWQQTFANEASQAKIVMQIGVIWVWINLGYVPSVIDHSQHLKPARTHVYSCTSSHVDTLITVLSRFFYPVSELANKLIRV